MPLSRKILTLALAPLMALAAMTAVAPAAHADRCQPEELAQQQGLIPEPANPVCLVTDEVVYPLLGCPPPTTLMTCQTSIGKITSNAPKAPQYVLNAAFKAPETTKNFTFFASNGTVELLPDGRVVCVNYYLLLPNRDCI
jgi:hypothetical protein